MACGADPPRPQGRAAADPIEARFGEGRCGCQDHRRAWQPFPGAARFGNLTPTQSEALRLLLSHLFAASAAGIAVSHCTFAPPPSAASHLVPGPPYPSVAGLIFRGHAGSGVPCASSWPRASPRSRILSIVICDRLSNSHDAMRTPTNPTLTVAAHRSPSMHPDGPIRDPGRAWHRAGHRKEQQARSGDSG